MSQSVEITKDNIENWKSFLRSSIKYLDIYRDLLETYVLDFFTEDIWNSINPGWRDALGSLTPNQLADFLTCDESLRQEEVWPLSLQALRVAAFTYALPRKPITTDAPFLNYLYKYTPSIDRRKSSSCGSPNLVHHGINYKLPCASYIDSRTEHSSTCRLQVDEANVKPDDLEKKDTDRLLEQSLSSDNFETSLPVSREHCEKQLDQTHPLQQMTVSWGDATSELSPGAGQHKLLQHVFRRHLKPKKQHEVARLAYIAGKVAQGACGGVMVDVGSGQGHLSRFLAYGHDVRVVCLEAQDEFIKGAKKFDSQLEMAVEKMKRRQDSLPPLPPPPRHSVCHLEPDMDPLTFREVVTSAWPELESEESACGLLGLHTCGNLASTLLRIFTNLPMCHAVVSVGCCYMKLNVNGDESGYPGYPMSTFVQSINGNSLSYEAREVACHAIEMYTSRLRLGAENLKVHCYRAALEEIIIKHWPEHRHAGLRSVNHAHKMDFAQYAVAAVNRLENVRLSEEDLNSERTQHNLSRWMQVVVYYSLRLLLAPVVESVVLLDRLLFLYEKGIESILLPAFDPQLSPRNHVLVAIKHQDEL